MVRLCERLETAHGLTERSLRFEVQVETPQAVLGADGTATVARIVHAAAGRCTGLHYGTYDYSAALGVAAAYQSMEHPVADHAKAVLQVAAARTGVRVSDGSTNVLPVGDTESVRAGWALHARLVRRSLERGIYQGWDLHPAQLPTRYLATYAFYREGPAAAAARLRAYASRADSGVLDEPATALALAGFLLRGVDCGALDADEVLAATGLDRPALDRHARRGGAGAVARLDRLATAELHAELLRGVRVAAMGRRSRRGPPVHERGRAVRRRRPGPRRAVRGRPGPGAGRPPAHRRARPAARRPGASSPVSPTRPAPRSPRGTVSTRRGSATSTWSARAAATARSCWPC